MVTSGSSLKRLGCGDSGSPLGSSFKLASDVLSLAGDPGICFSGSLVGVGVGVLVSAERKGRAGGAGLTLGPDIALDEGWRDDIRCRRECASDADSSDRSGEEGDGRKYGFGLALALALALAPSTAQRRGQSHQATHFRFGMRDRKIPRPRCP